MQSEPVLRFAAKSTCRQTGTVAATISPPALNAQEQPSDKSNRPEEHKEKETMRPRYTVPWM